MDTGEWVTSTIAALALVVSVIALVIALRSAKNVGRAGRVEPVAGQRPGRQPELRPEPEPSPGSEPEPASEPEPELGPVVWRIERDAGLSWRLRNVGSEPAFDVHAIALPAESASLVKVAQSFADVPVNGTLGFQVVRTAHHPDVTGLAVTWSGQTDPVVVPMA